MVWVALPSLIWEVPRATCPGSYHGPIMNLDFESAKAGARGTESEHCIQSACAMLTSAPFCYSWRESGCCFAEGRSLDRGFQVRRARCTATRFQSASAYQPVVKVCLHRGQDGSLLHSCMTLSFTTPRRFIPAHTTGC